jgi:hypothetical protein
MHAEGAEYGSVATAVTPDNSPYTYNGMGER